MIGRIAQGAMHVYDPKQKRFVPFLDGLPASEFVISPDKKWMVYPDYPRHYFWRSKLDGSEKLQLTDSMPPCRDGPPTARASRFLTGTSSTWFRSTEAAPEKLIAEA